MIYLNRILVTPTLFPDNTTQVWSISNKLLSSNASPLVEWEFNDESEFLHLAQLKTLLDEYAPAVDLFIYYLPYARQDKEVAINKTFALRTFAKLLNTLRFNSIVILDPHSDVATRLIKNSEAVYPILQAKLAFERAKASIVCYPDKGAETKYSAIYDFDYVSADKHRNQLTGEIVGLNLSGDVKGKTVLIVDDICDGGATFERLANELYKADAKKVHLFVTHGLFSKGTEGLRAHKIKRIFTVAHDRSGCLMERQ